MTIKINEKNYDEHDLMDAWRTGNDAGNGYAIGDADHTPQQAIESTDTMTHRGDITPEGTSVASDHGRVIVVANCNGPWAVDVTGMFDECGEYLGNKWWNWHDADIAMRGYPSVDEAEDICNQYVLGRTDVGPER